jgi:hypothetical protein
MSSEQLGNEAGLFLLFDSIFSNIVAMAVGS